MVAQNTRVHMPVQGMLVGGGWEQLTVGKYNATVVGHLDTVNPEEAEDSLE